MSTELARRYRVEVSTDGTTWVRVNGINDLSPQVTPNKQDDSDYENDGWMSQVITQQAWTLGIKYNAKASAGVRDAGQALIEARVGQFDTASTINVRWYDKTGLPEAKQGVAIVEVQRAKTGVADLNEMQATLTGQGALNNISNPYSASSAPVITSASQSGSGVGSQVTISGQNFTGTTAVKFGATTVTQYTVLSDSVIVAVVPTGGTGAVSITVTNGTGTSTGYSFTVA